jgi:hypothetical protein
LWETYYIYMIGGTCRVGASLHRNQGIPPHDSMTNDELSWWQLPHVRCYR